MNTQTYNEIGREVGTELNNFFEQFCVKYPEYQTIKNDYLRKKTHLNGLQFYAGFISGKSKNWENHIEVPIAIEMVMIWAYKTNRILDKKQDVWAKEENLKNTALEHDLMLACIYSLLESYSQKKISKNERIKDIIGHCLSRLAYGFWIERSISVKYTKLEEILIDWDLKHVDRNINFNLVYDYASIVGYAISSGDFSIIDKYEREFDPQERFSNAGQIINDLGDFGNDIDKHVKVYQDLFSDIRNGIITFPVHTLIGEKLVLRALKMPNLTRTKFWQWRMRRLIASKNVSADVLRISEKAYYAHKNFFEKHIPNLNPLLLRTYGMLINNKYFNQNIIKEEGSVLRSRVVLCSNLGKTLGNYDKLAAHKEGKLHKAFSILVFNKKGELLIQKRAEGKYHSGGLWANTCCSHYMESESVEVTIHRRLEEEMGFDCDLKKRFSFVYNLDVGNGMREHEFDTVFEGEYNGEINPNPDEVSDVKWISIKELRKDITTYPEKYAEWFKKIIERMNGSKAYFTKNMNQN